MTASVVIGNLIYLVGAVVVASIAGVIVAWFHRRPTSTESNLKSFNRGLQALAPEPATRRLPASGVHEITVKAQETEGEAG